jgi:HK97 family phage prohead protease
MTTVAVEPPKIPHNTTERRTLSFDTLEVRDDAGKVIVQGHAAVFDRMSEDLGGFRERIQRGAFRKVLDANPDVRFLVNHTGLPLARTTNQTLELREDPKGLRVYAELAGTTLAKDLQILVRRGDVNQMSFGFNMRGGTDVWKDDDGQLVRTIVSFGELFDVSAVTFPAYPQTDVSARTHVCGIEIVTGAGEVSERALAEVAWKIHRGETAATVDERAAIDAAFSRTQTVSPWMAQRALEAASQEHELQGAIPGKRATVALHDTTADAGQVAYRLAARKRRLRQFDTTRS